MENRRSFVSGLVASVALAGCATVDVARNAAHPEESETKSDDVEISPGEDLMQEHGVLQRLFLVYDDALRRIGSGETIDGDAIASAAKLMRRFAEDYHEKSEEELVFPQLADHASVRELVATLKQQHERGRQLTDDILRLAGTAPSAALADPLRAYVRMMRPHIARENTVIFPAFRGVIGKKNYLKLGDKFEDREHKLLGPHGFEDAVKEVAKIEVVWGIDDLARYTASPSSPTAG